MKALLVYPPSENRLRTNVPSVVDEETGVYPPLGVLYVAAYAREHTNFEIEVLDCLAERINYEKLEEEILKRKPQVVGIQTLTFNLLDVLKTAKLIKQIDPAIHVCLGGPHVNIYPDETIAFGVIDSLVLGEGEVTFTDLLEALASGEDLNRVAGMVFLRDGNVVHTGTRDFVEDMDSLPFPARELTPYRKYYSVLAKRSPITTMMSSRGCPYNCLFCDRPHLGKRFRARSAEDVVEEMERCVKMGIEEFFFYDDTFTVDRGRVLEVCEEILRRGLKVGWDIRARVDHMDRDVLTRLKQAGCERIHYGVEAGTERILKVLRKGIDLNCVRKTFTMTRNVGITTLAYFMLGSPSETREEILQTIDFALELDPDYTHISLTTPFPATDLYRLGLENGILEQDYWREFARKPAGDFVPLLWEETLSRWELRDLLGYAYRRFYFRPTYLLRNLMKVRNVLELKRKVRAGWKLFWWRNTE